MRPGLHPLATLLAAALTLAACGDENNTPAPITLDDSIGLDVVISSDHAGLRGATSDLITAWTTIRGATDAEDPHAVATLAEADAPAVLEIRLTPDDDALGAEGYTLAKQDFGQGRSGLRVTAATPVGAMYGVYEVIGALGVRYYHPERAFIPSDPTRAALPEVTEGPRQPAFATRGFHEHTQHPIIASDILLRPGDDQRRAFASNLVRWLARNRQNTLSFHMLNTLDMDAWLPYIKGIAEEADGWGVEVGATLSFADQQQNNYKLISAEGQQAAPQIQQNLRRILAEGGLDFITVQIGTSEFTKPGDDEMLGWIEEANTLRKAEFPNTDLRVWIHPPCDLEADSEGLFFHLPERSSADVALMVHTTMFYTGEHPAPVYGCQDFKHQAALLDRTTGKRELLWYPETAWWLGFDNNMPLTLPITGWSRQYDIQEILSKREVSGHVTFTTGREWAYWQYDHHLTQITWDASFGWDRYLDWIAPMYGANGAKVAEVLKAWTALQVDDFYTKNPLIYFYLSGELTQDEVGERAGVLARRPKVAYDRVVKMTDAEFTAWKRDDFDMLVAMVPRYKAELDKLPEGPGEGATAEQAALHLEVRTALVLYVKRIEHAIALYSGVQEARKWALEQQAARDGEREPDTTIRDAAKLKWQEHLEAARAISAEVKTLIGAVEANYRYPLDLLIQDKPESLTAYPFGYLKETHEAFFWTRRDEQLDVFGRRIFDESDDAWITEPDVVFITNAAGTELLVPENPLAARVLSSFVPQMLFGASAYDRQAGTMTLIVGEDYNENFLPDEGTELSVAGAFAADAPGRWTGSAETFRLVVHDTAGNAVGDLLVHDPKFTLEVERGDGPVVQRFVEGLLEGEYESAAFIALLRSFAGIDEEGAANLLKQVYKIELAEPLPARLPITFKFTFSALS